MSFCGRTRYNRRLLKKGIISVEHNIILDNGLGGSPSSFTGYVVYAVFICRLAVNYCMLYTVCCTPNALRCAAVAVFFDGTMEITHQVRIDGRDGQLRRRSGINN